MKYSLGCPHQFLTTPTLQFCQEAGACSANGKSKANFPTNLLNFASLGEELMKLEFKGVSPNRLKGRGFS
jgi:hypothetical protein